MMRESYESFMESSLSLVCLSCRASSISFPPPDSSSALLQLPLIVSLICIYTQLHKVLGLGWHPLAVSPSPFQQEKVAWFFFQSGCFPLMLLKAAGCKIKVPEGFAPPGRGNSHSLSPHPSNLCLPKKTPCPASNDLIRATGEGGSKDKSTEQRCSGCSGR